MSELTHYRKAFNSPYLSSADIVQPTILTIERVCLENDKTKKSKDVFNTAYFVEKELRPGEKLKPMILNAHNSKMLKKLTGKSFLEEWANLPVTIYVDPNVRFGRDTVEGLRIHPDAPQLTKPVLEPSLENRWKNAIASYQKEGNLNKVKSKMDITPENEALLIQQATDTGSVANG